MHTLTQAESCGVQWIWGLLHAWPHASRLGCRHEASKIASFIPTPAEKTMNVARSDQKILAAVIAAIVCVGASAPTFAQDQQGSQRGPQSQKTEVQKQQDAEKAAKAKKEAAKAQAQQAEKQREAAAKQEKAKAQQQDRIQQARARQAEKDRAAAAQQRERMQAKQQDRVQQARAQQAEKDRAVAAQRLKEQQARTQAARETAARAQAQQRQTRQQQAAQQQQRRLSQREQQERINEQKQRIAQYQRRLDQQREASRRFIQQLQAQHRMAQYRFQQQYFARLERQREALRTRRFDYDNDPYFYTAPIYRYSRGGVWYQANQYGADHMRQAINTGYEQGFAAGRADREDRARYNYRDSFAYQDATYGYEGYYVSAEDYIYFFREGFRRGYEDGYYSRYRYGSNANGVFRLHDGELSLVLNLQSLR